MCGFSLTVASRGYSSSRCAGFSLKWLLLLQSTGSRRTGFSSCGSRALERRLSSCGARAQLLRGMWDLPGPGLEPVSPALAGGFLTTMPPGKSLYLYFYHTPGNSLKAGELLVDCVNSYACLVFFRVGPMDLRKSQTFLGIYGFSMKFSSFCFLIGIYIYIYIYIYIFFFFPCVMKITSS